MRINLFFILLLLVSCNGSGGGGVTGKESLGHTPDPDVDKGVIETVVWWATIDEGDPAFQVFGRIKLDCDKEKCLIEAGIGQPVGSGHYRDSIFKGSLVFEEFSPVTEHYHIGLLQLNEASAGFSLILNRQLEPVQIRNTSYCSLFTILSELSDDFLGFKEGKIGISDHNLLAHDRANHVSDPACDL